MSQSINTNINDFSNVFDRINKKIQMLIQYKDLYPYLNREEIEHIYKNMHSITTYSLKDYQNLLQIEKELDKVAIGASVGKMVNKSLN